MSSNVRDVVLFSFYSGTWPGQMHHGQNEGRVTYPSPISHESLLSGNPIRHMINTWSVMHVQIYLQSQLELVRNRCAQSGWRWQYWHARWIAWAIQNSAGASRMETHHPARCPWTMTINICTSIIFLPDQNKISAALDCCFLITC